MGLGPLENAIGKLAHQRLTVGRAFSGDDKGGLSYYLIEVDGFKQKVNA